MSDYKEYKIDNSKKYTKEHEWVEIQGEYALIGISDFAQHALGDIVYIELPNTGDVFEKGQTLGVVESVKAAEDYYSPVSGEVIEINADISDDPAIVNSYPYDSWFVKIKMNETPKDLLSPSEYQQFIPQED